jgi:hypothetical protein
VIYTVSIIAVLEVEIEKNRWGKLEHLRRKEAAVVEEVAAQIRMVLHMREHTRSSAQI